MFVWKKRSFREYWNQHIAENYTENMQSIIFGIMSVLYNKPYEEFEKQAGVNSKNQIATMIQWMIMN